MSETKERPKGKIVAASDPITLLDDATLPAKSTLRFSRSMSSVEDAVQDINDGLREIEQNHVRKDEDGDPIVRVVLEKTGEVVGETPVEGEGQSLQYKEIDLESMDFDSEDDYELSEDDYGGDVPATREQYVFDDQQEMIESRREALQDPTEIEVHPFPEDEVEDVLSAFKEERVRQQVEEIESRLDLDESEVETVEEILNVSDKESRLRPSEIKDIEFLFPEDF